MSETENKVIFKPGETVTIRDDIDFDAVVNAVIEGLGGRDALIEQGEVWLTGSCDYTDLTLKYYADGFHTCLMLYNGATTPYQMYIYVDDNSRRILQEVYKLTFPEGVRGWYDFSKNEIVTGIKFTILHEPDYSECVQYMPFSVDTLAKLFFVEYANTADDSVKDTYLTDLFIKEAKPALKRHSGSGGGSVIKPLTITANGVYDTTSGGEFKANTMLTLKDEGIDIQAMIHAAGGASAIESTEGAPIMDGPTFNVDFIYDNGVLVLHLYIDEQDTSYLYIDENLRMALLDMAGIVIPEEAKGWLNFNEFQSTGAVKIATGLQVETSTREHHEAVEHIAPLEQTAEWLFVEDAFTEGYDGANPITVNVPTINAKPLSVTENGTYTAEEGFAYTPVRVNVPSKNNLKSLIDGRRSANYLFYNFEGSDPSNIISYDDTENATDFNHMFAFNHTSWGRNLVAPLLNTSKGTNFTYMFHNRTEMSEVPLYDTRNATSMNYMFADIMNVNYSLTVIPAFDLRSGTNIEYLTAWCSAVTEIWVKNIKSNFRIYGVNEGTGNSYGSQITVESLIHLIRELRNTGSVKTLTMGSINIDKLANIYVRTVEVTDEMRAEDDLIDEKLPFEVCESTDEGAMLITDYVALKNWEIK